MTAAYNVRVAGEVATTYHFEEKLAERDVQILLWWEKSSFQVDDVTVEERAPIPGVRAISFRQWMGQNMTPTEVVKAPAAPMPEPELLGPASFPDGSDGPGEDLRDGTVGRETRPSKDGSTRSGQRMFSAERLSADWRRVAAPARPWLYVRIDSIVGMEDVDVATDEGRAYAMDYARRSFGKPPTTYVELGVSTMSDVPMAAIWNGGAEGPGEEDRPDW